MEYLSYKGGCGVRESTHIEEFKRRAGLGYTVDNFGLLLIQCYLKQLYH